MTVACIFILRYIYFSSAVNPGAFLYEYSEKTQEWFSDNTIFLYSFCTYSLHIVHNYRVKNRKLSIDKGKYVWYTIRWCSRFILFRSFRRFDRQRVTHKRLSEFYGARLIFRNRFSIGTKFTFWISPIFNRDLKGGSLQFVYFGYEICAFWILIFCLIAYNIFEGIYR